MTNVNFETHKALVRSQIASELSNQIDYKSPIIESITEKIMARQFNQNFDRGEGKTTDSHLTPSIKLSFKNQMRALGKGVGISGYTMIQVLKSKETLQTIENLGWVYAIPKQYIAEHEAIQDLEKFLDSTLRTQGLVPPARYMVQSGTISKQTKYGRVDLVPYIGSKILALENKKRFKTIGDLLKRTLVWIKASKSHPILFLIGPEYIVDVPAVKLRRMQVGDVLITTQSQLLAPPWVFKSSKTANRVMFWYSNNSSQILKEDKAKLDYTYLTQNQISKHFVWTPSWGKILKEYNPNSQVTPIGPVIFKDLSGYVDAPKEYTRDKKTILVFDVTPKVNASRDSFYSDTQMKQFISDIVWTINRKYPEAVIKLKPKREYSSGDSSVYQDFLKSQNSNINILRWNTNIINEIRKSDLVICIPFSSPALISKYLGVPTLFYSPSLEFNLEEKHEGISVVEGIDQLQLFLEKFENE